MRDAGATEVHMRIASPPIKFPDYYGIDTPVKEQLLAANNSLEDMSDFIGVDSLAFLTVDGLYKAMGHDAGRDPNDPFFTDHCFTGDYPTKLRDLESGRWCQAAVTFIRVEIKNSLNIHICNSIALVFIKMTTAGVSLIFRSEMRWHIN